MSRFDKAISATVRDTYRSDLTVDYVASLIIARTSRSKWPRIYIYRVDRFIFSDLSLEEAVRQATGVKLSTYRSIFLQITEYRSTAHACQKPVNARLAKSARYFVIFAQIRYRRLMPHAYKPIVGCDLVPKQSGRLGARIIYAANSARDAANQIVISLAVS